MALEILISIGSVNGFLLIQCQAIIGTNAGLIGPWNTTNFIKKNCIFKNISWHACRQFYTDQNIFSYHADGLVPKNVTPLLMNWSYIFLAFTHPFDGLVQERHNSIANALELRLSYTYPSCVHQHIIPMSVSSSVVTWWSLFYWPH